MKGDFLTCPACGTRNKPKWDFCARCGESLQGVSLGEPATEEATLEEPVSSEASAWPIVVGLVAFGALAVGARWWWERRETASPPNPSIFTLATLPPSAPAGRPPIKEPGKTDFEAGFRMLAAGDAPGAVARLAQAVADAPNNAYYRNIYAKALLASGSITQALAQFDAALSLSPDSVGYLFDTARALDRAGKGADAARAYESILARQPQNEQTLRDLSSLHERNGHFDLALPLLRRLAEAKPDDLVVRQELGHTLEKTGDLKAARLEYEKILDDKPDAHITRGLLAEIHFNQGEKDEAIALLRDGLARDGQAPLLHRGLASLLERSGDVAEAVKEYREYARLAPNAPDAQQLADRANRLERRLAAASPSPPGT
jgi:Flp pilus assembly protein TadD